MSMSEEQKALLELLIKVKSFLDENDITFYLFGGSCMGALRHHGFIPWDDDIDIIMDRNNYEKLIKASYNMPSDDFEFWSFEKSDYYFKAFGQFSSKKDTYFVKSRVFNRGLCMGTIIDVFVLDYVPSSKLEEYKKDLLMYEEVLGHYKLHRNEINQYKNEYYSLIKKEKDCGRRNVIEGLQANIEKYDESNSDLLAVRFWVRKFRYYKKEWFGQPRYCEFEGYMMPIPACAEATLRQQYGYNWQYLPNEENREFHKFYIDHNISSNNYVEDMEQFFDTSSINSMWEDNKHYLVERLDSQLRMQEIAKQLQRKKLLLEYKEEIANDDFSKLNSLINGISSFTNEDFNTTLSESFLSAWVLWLIKKGFYFKALKIVDAFLPDNDFYYTLENDLPFFDMSNCNCDSLVDLSHLLNQLILLDAAWQDKRYNDIMKILSSISVDIRFDIPTCIIAWAKYILDFQDDPGSVPELIDYCEKYLSQNPSNYDILKIKADLLYAQGQIDEANSLYKIVLEKSQNGLDIISLNY